MVTEEMIVKEENQVHQNQFKVENRKLLEKYENKCIENKHLKDDIETLKKEKNELSVALKRSKQENKEQIKTAEKEKGHFEKKILELNEFKVKKLQEEREEKIKRKKETKKANQKEKKDTLNAAEDAKTHDSNEFVNTPVIEPKQILVQNPILQNKDASEDVIASDRDNTTPELNGNLVKEDIEDKVSVGKADTTKDLEEKTEEIVNEDEEGFIGPKLPKRMTAEEIEEFRKELFRKWKFPM